MNPSDPRQRKIGKRRDSSPSQLNPGASWHRKKRSEGLDFPVMTANRPKLDAILRELSTALRGRYGDRYVRLWLYGSEARGEAHADSDVDVLLVLREVSHPTREIDRIADILADFNLRYGVLLSVLP